MTRSPTRPGLLANIGWMAAAEGASRITRLAAALALAYALEPAAFGAAALVMTVADFLRTPTRNGVLHAVIRSPESELPGTLETATRLNWIVHLALAGVQIALARPLALWLGAPEIEAPLMVLAAIYLFYPIVFPRVALLHRAGAMKWVAALGGACLSFANLATAVCALAGFGIWSVVLPRLVSAALWVVLARRMQPRPNLPRSAPADWRAVFRYGRAILGSELLKAARLNLDKIIVGKLLGMEALGYYAFAFNAGLGLSQSLLKGFSDALFPHLCAERRAGRLGTGSRGLVLGSLGAATLLFGTQAALAPIYVPLLFGARWEAAIPVLAILCLSAIPRPLWEIASQTARARGEAERELRWSVAFTAAILLGVALGSITGGLSGAALAILAVHTAFEPAFARSVLRVPASPQTGPCHAL